MSLAVSTAHHIDKNSNGVVSIGEFHSLQHAGRVFNISEFASTVTLTSGVDFYFVTGAKYAHADFEVDANADVVISCRKNISVTATQLAALTALSSVNTELYSTNVASSVAYRSGTITGSGTLFFTKYLPGVAGKKSQGGVGVARQREWILDKDTKYMFRIKPVTTSALCGVVFNFYEV